MAYVIVTADGYDIAFETQACANQHVRELRKECEIEAKLVYVPSMQWADAMETALYERESKASDSAESVAKWCRKWLAREIVSEMIES